MSLQNVQYKSLFPNARINKITLPQILEKTYIYNVKNHIMTTNRKILYIFSLFCALVFCACTEVTESPILSTACFEMQNDTYEVGDTALLTNCSENATIFSWDFGDGTSSQEIEAAHIFTHSGSYNVTLISENESSKDSISKNVEVIDKYSNYIQFDHTQYEQKHISILQGTFIDRKQTSVFIGDKNTQIESDSIVGSGLGVCLVLNTRIREKEYILDNQSYLINSNKELSGARLNIISINENIELELFHDDVSIYYKGKFTAGTLENYPTFELLKEVMNVRFGSFTSHTFTQYHELMQELSKDKYTTLPINEMIETNDNNKIIVGLRHDVDNNPIAAMQMANIESEYNIRATYYMLATAWYYGYFNNGTITRYPCMERVYHHLHALNNEIGIHNDLIAVMISHEMDPFLFNHNELDYYASLGIPIYGSVGHGSFIASQTVHNSQIFSDFAKSDFIVYDGKSYPIGEHTMAEYGFSYEANYIDMSISFSDSGGTWDIEGGFDQVLDSLKISKPGDRVQILIHPCWWGE